MAPSGASSGEVMSVDGWSWVMRDLMRTRSWMALSLGLGVDVWPCFLWGCTRTFRTSPSLSGVAEVITPVGQSSRGAFFSLKRTVSPI